MYAAIFSYSYVQGARAAQGQTGLARGAEGGLTAREGAASAQVRLLMGHPERRHLLQLLHADSARHVPRSPAAPARLLLLLLLL